MSRTRLINSVLLPLGGFAVGWYGMSYVTDANLLGEENQRKLDVANLKLQRAVQSVLPASVVERYGVPPERLNELISAMETVPEPPARATFEQIFSECDIPEQISFLEDHAEEEIPYFYIGDVFHSWANVHRSEYAKEGPHAVVAQRNDARYESKVLCDELWKKVSNSVVPFDVGVRALAVLAVCNKSNARRLAEKPDAMAAVVRQYAAYRRELDASADPADEVVPTAEVLAATLLLLRTLNDAAVRRPLLGRGTGPYPAAAAVTPDDWCGNFSAARLLRDDTTRVADGALLLTDVLNERFRCPNLEKEQASQP